LPDIEYRHPREADLPDITRIWNDSMRGLPLHRALTLEEVRTDTFADRDYDPEGAWLAVLGGNPVGYGDGLLEKERIERGKEGLASIYVMHDKRGNGIEDHLLELVLEYLAGKGFGAAQVWCNLLDDWKTSLYRRAGFEEQRRFFSMILSDNTEPAEPAFPEGIRIDRRPLKGIPEEDLRVFVDVFNESFARHFSFSPTNVTRWRNIGNAAADEMIVTFARDEGEVVGFTLVENSTAYNREKGTKDGWVSILGVVPGSRGKGLGKALLLDGIRQLLSHGLDTVRLGLDAENRNALSLYTSVGFEIALENIVLAKDISSLRRA